MYGEFAAAQELLSHCKGDIALAQLAVREEQDLPRWDHIERPTSELLRMSGREMEGRNNDKSRSVWDSDT